MNSVSNRSSFSRRQFVQGGAAAVLASASVFEGLAAATALPIDGAAALRLSLDSGWLFGGKLTDGALAPEFKDTAFASVTLPHTVVPLSWQKWNPDTWQDRWVYRRHFTVPPQFKGLRLFLHFDRVMASAAPSINGHALTRHDGGYLPFEYEITQFVHADGWDNVLALAVDATWLNVPPAGSPKGAPAVDYLLPGGITGSAYLYAVPGVFLRDVFAKPVNVLASDRRLDVLCTLDSAPEAASTVQISASLLDGERVVGHAETSVKLEKSGQQVPLSISRLDNVKLWDVDHPQLYTVKVTLSSGGKALHTYTTRTGFREARFSVDGFFLNGKRLQLFGLNRHELFPYLGYAAPARLQRRDAEMLRKDLNCNIVRCSHYPQSTAFFEACDELGLMVWEEIPGWQYVGDEAWKELAVQEVEGMVRRDRNHASIIVWGTRVNESANFPALYERTRALALSLDDSRPTSGSMTNDSAKEYKTAWHEDVFAWDDYHAEPDGTVGIYPPLEGVPYMLAETVGQFNYSNRRYFTAKYRRAGDVTLQMQQAVRHAQAHDRAAAYPRMAGTIAWCGFDYASLMNAEAGVKCPGVVDVFRIPKLGAAFYLTQGDPHVRPAIEPGFFWDFGTRTPNGPGEHAPIFSNCDRLELFLDGKAHGTLEPDRSGYPHTKHPPFFADLKLDGPSELRIDGFVDGKKVLSRSFSADRSGDRLWLHVDDAELVGDGSDMTRVAFGVVDRFGAFRLAAEGEVRLTVDGPGELVGDNPFLLADSGGVGAVWLRTVPGRTGVVRVAAKHSMLGAQNVEVRVR